MDTLPTEIVLLLVEDEVVYYTLRSLNSYYLHLLDKEFMIDEHYAEDDYSFGLKFWPSNIRYSQRAENNNLVYRFLEDNGNYVNSYDYSKKQIEYEYGYKTIISSHAYSSDTIEREYNSEGKLYSKICKKDEFNWCKGKFAYVKRVEYSDVRNLSKKWRKESKSGRYVNVVASIKASYELDGKLISKTITNKDGKVCKVRKSSYDWEPRTKTKVYNDKGKLILTIIKSEIRSSSDYNFKREYNYDWITGEYTVEDERDDYVFKYEYIIDKETYKHQKDWNKTYRLKLHNGDIAYSQNYEEHSHNWKNLINWKR